MIQYLLLLVVAYSCSVVGGPVFVRFLDETGLHRANYAGRTLPLGAGLFLVLSVPALLVLGVLAGVPALPIQLSLIVSLGLIGFGLAGLVDDCLGSPGDKGFRGHFIALFREGRLTSGVLKALFGGAVALLTALALASSYPRLFGPWYQILLNAVILASAANLLNLLDLRPGRAGKVFYLGLVLGAALAARIDLFSAPILLVAVAFLPLFRLDLRARVMLGDTGANLLGATLGMAMAFWLSWHAKIVAALILLGLQLLSERYSFSAVIERVAILRLVDSWGRTEE